VLYCAAAKESQFVPYSDALTSTCQTDSHEYCDAYLAMAPPARHPDEWIPVSGGVLVLRARCSYASNHMWIDRRDDESCHIGVDAFLARLLGTIDSVDFVQSRGTCQPTVVLAVRGADLRLVFPNVVHVTAVNSALRGSPGRILVDPYSRGWLFAGREAFEGSARRADHGLLRDDAAKHWMEDELRKAAEFAGTAAPAPLAEGGALMNDGGVPSERFSDHLGRADLLRLFARFFSLERSREAS
jgi:glycine cleavage system H lipoate-binding protein